MCGIIVYRWKRAVVKRSMDSQPVVVKGGDNTEARRGVEWEILVLVLRVRREIRKVVVVCLLIAFVAP